MSDAIILFYTGFSYQGSRKHEMLSPSVFIFQEMKPRCGDISGSQKQKAPRVYLGLRKAYLHLKD